MLQSLRRRWRLRAAASLRVRHAGSRPRDLGRLDVAAGAVDRHRHASVEWIEPGGSRCYARADALTRDQYAHASFSASRDRWKPGTRGAELARRAARAMNLSRMAPDSAPRVDRSWGCSSAGRAPAWHAGGRGFESPSSTIFIGQAQVVPRSSPFVLTTEGFVCCLGDGQR